MKKLSKLFALILVFSMTVGSLVMNASASSATGYNDVDADAPYAEAVEVLTEAGIIVGVGHNMFEPNGLVTRAQVITALGRLAGVMPSESSQFTDVVPNSWYSGYVGWAVEKGIVEGNGQGKFMPEANITSNHLDLMLGRYAEIAGVSYTAAGTGAESVSRADLAQRLLVFMKDTNEENAPAFKLLAADATFQGKGLAVTGEEKEITYDADANVIMYMDEGATASYTVPSGVNGEYDIYIEIGKSAYPYGSTPFRLLINGEAQYILPAVTEMCASDLSDINDKGTIQLASSKELKAGDTLTILAQPGYGIHAGVYNVNFLPSIGDIYLYPTGTEVAVGYNGGTVKKPESADPNDPLSGLNIAWLGSSVTYGMQSGGYTMADEIAAKHPATESYKYAISGTTLVNDTATSYVTRMKEINPDTSFDLFVVQLSTNDAGNHKPLGTLTDSKDPATFDDTTIIGAIESIIVYVRDTWNCPVVFYTGTYFEEAEYASEYAAMVDALLEIQQKWDIGIVDLWNNADMTAVYNSDLYHSYMGDEVHPVRDGYVKWWTPEFENSLTDILSK